MHRLLAVLIVAVTIAGCKRSDQTESQLSWPQILWQVTYRKGYFPRVISIAPDQGFIVLLEGAPEVAGPYPYLLRYTSEGLLQDSVLMDFPVTKFRSSQAPTLVYDKADSGSIWVGYQRHGLNIDCFDSELTRVHSIRDTSFKSWLSAICVTPKEVLLIAENRLSYNSIESKLVRLDMNGTVLSSTTLPSEGEDDELAYTEIDLKYIEPTTSGNFYIIGTAKLSSIQHGNSSAFVYLALIDSSGNFVWDKVSFGHKYAYVTGITTLAGDSLLVSASWRDRSPARGLDSSHTIFAVISPHGEVSVRNDIITKSQDNSVVTFAKLPTEIVAFGNPKGRSMIDGQVSPLFLLTLSREGAPRTRSMTGYAFSVADVAVRPDGTFLIAGYDQSSMKPSIALLRR